MGMEGKGREGEEKVRGRTGGIRSNWAPRVLVSAYIDLNLPSTINHSYPLYE